MCAVMAFHPSFVPYAGLLLIVVRYAIVLVPVYFPLCPEHILYQLCHLEGTSPGFVGVK